MLISLSMLKRLISPFSKLLIRGCVSLKNSAASAMLDCPPQRRYAPRQRKRVFTLATPADQKPFYRGYFRVLSIRTDSLSCTVTASSTSVAATVLSELLLDR